MFARQTCLYEGPQVTVDAANHLEMVLIFLDTYKK
jgi:hypothetical protein